MAEDHRGYDISTLVAGLADDSPPVAGAFDIDGPEDVEEWIGAATRAPNTQAMLTRLASANPRGRLNSATGQMIQRLGKISRQMLLQTGRIEAEYLRRPNTLVSVYTPVIAPGATSAFSVQPGQGNSYYRLLGFICTDDQSNIFGFSSLKVGGQEHVQFSQSTPTPPVASAVPWAMFQLKEQSLKTNLAPWSGQVFDNSTPVTGTIVNMTVAASGDAVTVAARIVLLTQTDPCGTRYDQLKNASSRYWGSLRNNIGAYAPLMSGT